MKHIARKIEEYRFVWTVLNRRQTCFLLEVSFVGNRPSLVSGTQSLPGTLPDGTVRLSHEIGQKSETFYITSEKLLQID